MNNLKILALLMFFSTSIILLHANNEEIDQTHQTATPKKSIFTQDQFDALQARRNSMTPEQKAARQARWKNISPSRKSKKNNVRQTLSPETHRDSNDYHSDNSITTTTSSISTESSIH